MYTAFFVCVHTCVNMLCNMFTHSVQHFDTMCQHVVQHTHHVMHTLTHINTHNNMHDMFAHIVYKHCQHVVMMFRKTSYVTSCRDIKTMPVTLTCVCIEHIMWCWMHCCITIECLMHECVNQIGSFYKDIERKIFYIPWKNFPHSVRTKQS